MKHPLIVSNLKKSFKVKGGSVDALRGISFNVKKGEIFGLLGPNGAGKTTTINILTGILTPEAGEIKYFGTAINEDVKNKINAATAYNALNGSLTVYQNLMVYSKIYNLKDPLKKIKELLNMFDISELKDRLVWDLSAGQKTRVNLCKALLNDPKLIFLDEATAGLDPHIASKVRDIIKKLDTTIIFTSHIMQEVEILCNRIAFLSQGKILKIDSPSGIKKLIKENIFVIDFLSMPDDPRKTLKHFEIINKKRNKIAVKLKNSKQIHQIIKALVAADFEIRDFHIKRPTLDEVFIKIAKGEL